MSGETSVAQTSRAQGVSILQPTLALVFGSSSERTYQLDVPILYSDRSEQTDHTFPARPVAARHNGQKYHAGFATGGGGNPSITSDNSAVSGVSGKF